MPPAARPSALFRLRKEHFAHLLTRSNHDPSSAPPHRAVSMSQLLSQLWHAVTGDGAETANDVRPCFSLPTHISSAFDRSCHPNQSTIHSARLADAMAHQTDDAQLPVDLPPLPYASRAPASPERHSGTPIDLTSPPASPQGSRKRQHAPDNRRPGLGSNRRASDDEKRLTGDYEYSNTLRL